MALVGGRHADGVASEEVGRALVGEHRRGVERQSAAGAESVVAVVGQHDGDDVEELVGLERHADGGRVGREAREVALHGVVLLEGDALDVVARHGRCHGEGGCTAGCLEGGAGGRRIDFALVGLVEVLVGRERDLVVARGVALVGRPEGTEAICPVGDLLAGLGIGDVGVWV